MASLLNFAKLSYETYLSALVLLIYIYVYIYSSDLSIYEPEGLLELVHGQLGVEILLIHRLLHGWGLVYSVIYIYIYIYIDYIDRFIFRVHRDVTLPKTWKRQIM